MRSLNEIAFTALRTQISPQLLDDSVASKGQIRPTKWRRINIEASLSTKTFSKSKLKDDGESSSEKELLGERRRALGERCRIERRCGCNRPFVTARNGAFQNGKAKRLND
jgi:CO/xanthine dehydrogenase Mo-binding subunit